MTPDATVLRDRLLASAQVKTELAADEQVLEGVAVVAALLVSCLRAGGTVWFCGNGGSSADAEHLCAELVGRFYVDRPPLRSGSLSATTATMTAVGNDYGYEEVFARQLAGLSRPGDVLVGLSTSGNSLNVVRAVEWGRAHGVTTVAFTGRDGGKLADVAEHVLRVPSDDTPRVQECHLHVGHTLCEIVEATLYPTG